MTILCKYFNFWAGYCKTPKKTKISRKNRVDFAMPKKLKKHEFYCKNRCQDFWITPKSTKITTKKKYRKN